MYSFHLGIELDDLELVSPSNLEPDDFDGANEFSVMFKTGWTQVMLVCKFVYGEGDDYGKIVGKVLSVCELDSDDDVVDSHDVCGMYVTVSLDDVWMVLSKDN